MASRADVNAEGTTEGKRVGRASARNRRRMRPRRAGSLAALIALLIPVGIVGLAAPASATATPVLRINAGGPEVAATDGGPAWLADDASAPSAMSNAGASGSTILTAAGAVSAPAGVPAAVLSDARVDSASGEPMRWTLDAPAGAYELRLHLAEIDPSAQVAGARTFGVTVDGAPMLISDDVYASAGADAGTTRSLRVDSDGTLEVEFVPGVGQPSVAGIELLSLDGPAVAASPAGHGFGEAVVGDSATQAVTLSLVGADGDSVDATSLTTTGDFSVDTSGPVSVVDGAPVPVEVTFAPSAEGVTSGSLIIETAGAAGTLVVPLSGIGVPAPPPDPGTLIAAPDAVDLGDVTVGETGTATVTLSNDGGTDVTVGAVDLAAPFTTDASAGLVIPAGGTADVEVGFAPSAEGAANGELSLSHDGSGGTVTVSLSGMGIAPVGTGDPGTGDPGTGDPGTGDPGTGDPGTGDPGTGGPVIQPLLAADAYSLVYSASSNRSAPMILDGATVSGSIYAFIDPPTDVTQVRFWLDDTATTGNPDQTESLAPFDFEGGSVAAATPFNTTGLADGEHTITALVSHDGVIDTYTATFTIANAAPSLQASPANVSVSTPADGAIATAGVTVSTSNAAAATVTATGSGAAWLSVAPASGAAPAAFTISADPAGLTSGIYSGSVTFSATGMNPVTVPVTFTVTGGAATYSLQLSTAANRSAPTPLDGATVSGNAYIFTAPDTAVQQVAFWLDNTAMTGAANRVETVGPFDYAGTGTGNTALPFNTNNISDGSHTITARVQRTDGAVVVVTSTFTVENATVTPTLEAAPGNLAFSVAQGGANQTGDVQITSSNGAAAAVTATPSGPAWLTVAPPTGTTPGTYTVTANPTGLAAGTYNGSVTFSAPGFDPVAVPVALVVAAPVGSYSLLVSEATTRVAPVPLDGATVDGAIFVFTDPDANVAQVAFWLDNPSMTGAATRTESVARFDFAGTATNGGALPFDTTSLADGAHTITARVVQSDGQVVILNSTFTVANTVTSPALQAAPGTVVFAVDEGASPVTQQVAISTSDAAAATVTATPSGPAWLDVTPTGGTTPTSFTVEADPTGLDPGVYNGSISFTASGFTSVAVPVELVVNAPAGDYDLVYSTSPNRGAPASLDGATVAGAIYAFTDPDAMVGQVQFWLDNPSMSGTATRTEGVARYDFAGTATNGNALPFTTTSLADGVHTITARMLLTDASVVVVTSTFTVANTAPSLVLGTASLGFSSVQDGGAQSNQVSIGTSNGADATVTATPSLSSTWISVVPTVGDTAGTFTVTVNPVGLLPAVYNGNVTFTAAGYTSVTLPVQLIVTGSSSGYSIQYSLAPDRVGAAPLNGATVSGSISVFTGPDTGVTLVQFWVDNPAMTGTPYRTESVSPYDLAGTGTGGTSLPFNTASMTNGTHTITARLVLADTTAEVLTATFTVSDAPPTLLTSASALSFALDEPDAPASSPVIITANTVTSTTVTAQVPAAATWLSVATPTLPTPATYTVIANPSGLAPGVYVETIQFTASGYTAASVTVTLVVDEAPEVCWPLSCGDLLVDLDYGLDFSEEAGGIVDRNGVGTGFTYVAPSSNGARYVPENIFVDLLAGDLELTTTAGLNVAGVDSLDNALGVGLDAPSQVSNVSTTIENIPMGTGGFEQAGLYWGLDEDNYAKLVVQSSAATTTRVQFLVEVNGVQAYQATVIDNSLPGRDITFNIIGDPVTANLQGRFSIDGGPSITVGSFDVPGEFFSFDAAGIDTRIGTRTYVGIMASHRSGPAPLTYVFTDFQVTEGEPVPTPSESWFDRVSHDVMMPTAMVWAPDNRLYVTEIFGTIHALTFDADYNVIDDEVMNVLDPGLTLGITVDSESTPENVIIWVSHSSASTDDGEVNSSHITRLSGPGLTSVEDVITGLPRAQANHAINGIHFDPDDDTLFIVIGGNTGTGAANNAASEFGDRPEQPLSAALLRADVKDPTFQGDCASPLGSFTIPSTCDVELYATGLRNTYDFVHASNGYIYGPNNALGVVGTYPPSPTPPCTALGDPALHNPGVQPDGLNLIEQGNYYGHPNPYRNECVFGDGSYQGVDPLPNYTPPILNLGNNRSADGIIEYGGGAFCGLIDGDLLITNYSVGDNLTRVELSEDGRSVVSSSSLLGGFDDPLPVALGPGGVIFVGEFGGSQVTALVPNNVGCWTPEPDVPVAMLNGGGASVGDTAYVVGGRVTGGDRTAATWAYDTTTDSWSQLGDRPGPASERPAVVALGSRVYAFGGSTEQYNGAIDSAAYLDTGSGTWTSVAPMPTARTGATAAVLGGDIWVIGGLDSTGASVPTVEIFDPDTGTWSAGPDLGTRRDVAGSAVSGGVLYVFGGRTRDSNGSTPTLVLDSYEIYDPGVGSWVTATMPNMRRAMAVGTAEGKIQLIGGELNPNNTALETVDEFDPATGTWSSLALMRTPRQGAAAATVADKVHVIGGGVLAGASGGTSYSDVHEVFSY